MTLRELIAFTTMQDSAEATMRNPYVAIVVVDWTGRADPQTCHEVRSAHEKEDSVVYTGNPVWDLVSGLSTDPESHAPRWRVDLLAAGRPVERRHLVLEARRRAPATGG